MIEIQALNGNLGGFRLQDIDLTVNDGEYMVLLGPTGAGPAAARAWCKSRL